MQRSKYLPQKEMNKVRFNKENSNTKQSKSKGVTFVFTYHPLLKSFQSLINKHLNVLCPDENAKEVFMPGPMVTFLKREDYWRRTLKTMAPFQLNIEDNYLISFNGD